MRLQGASYEEIARAGGGIVSTVRGDAGGVARTRCSSAALPRVDALIAEGRGGDRGQVGLRARYRHRAEDAARRAARLPRARTVRVRTSFLGAHAVPAEYRGRADAYIDEICLPALEARAAGWPMRSTGSAKASRFRRRRSPGCSTRARALRPAGQAACRAVVEPRRRATGGAVSARCRPIIWNMPRPRMPRPWPPPAPWRCCCPAPSIPCARRRRRRSRHSAPPAPMALATDCNPGSSPLTSLLLAHEHGLHPVPADPGRGAGRGHPRWRRRRWAWPIAAGWRRGCAPIWRSGMSTTPAELCLPHRLQPAACARFRRRGMSALILTPGAATLAQLERLWREGLPARLDPSARPGVEAAAALVAPRRGGGRGGLWRQHRLRQAGLGQDRRRRYRHAAAQPDPVALLRRRRGARAGHGAADDGAEAAVARAAAPRACAGRSWR